MEGRRHRALREDCQAVSEVVGQVLMIAIVVLAFSSIAVVIFSDSSCKSSSYAAYRSARKH